MPPCPRATVTIQPCAAAGTVTTPTPPSLLTASFPPPRTTHQPAIHGGRARQGCNGEHLVQQQRCLLQQELEVGLQDGADVGGLPLQVRQQQHVHLHRHPRAGPSGWLLSEWWVLLHAACGMLLQFRGVAWCCGCLKSKGHQQCMQLQTAGEGSCSMLATCQVQAQEWHC